MRITEAARRLDMTPRMLRYRESLGLLPALRERAGRHPRLLRQTRQVQQPHQAQQQPREPAQPWQPQQARPPRQPGTGRPTAAHRASGSSLTPHRQFSEADLAAVGLGLSIERRYDISPAALSFGIRVLADPQVRAEVAELGRRIGRIQPPPARALDFEKERAQRLLRLADRDRDR